MTKLRVLFLFVALFVLALPLQAQDVDIDDIIFARDATFGDVLPIQEDTVFPDTLTVVYAIIEGSGLEEGDEFDIVWSFEGDELDTLTYENTDGDDEFRVWTNWSDPDGLEDGDWAVEIYYDGDLIADGEFEVTSDEYVFPVRFAEDCSREAGILINEGLEFEDITFIYAYIEYANFNSETISVLWTIDEEVYDFDIDIEFDDEGWECVFLQNGDDPMPSGDYTVIIESEDGDEYRESHEIEIDS